jgi:hypothetical protein
MFRSAVRSHLEARRPDGSAASWEEYVRSSHLPVPGHFGGRRNVCEGLPQDDGTVRFKFERGNELYRQLVSTPGLSAIATVDRATGRIMGVGFRHRSRL